MAGRRRADRPCGTGRLDPWPGACMRPRVAPRKLSPRPANGLRGPVGSVIKKRRKRMAKKKHRKLLRKTRHQRRNKK